MSTRIDIIRHGEPVGGRRYRGHGVDDPLTEKGWQQMRAAVHKQPGWDHIVTSPLIRCRAFAEDLADELQVGLSIEPELREIGFGDWEGKTPDEILAADPNALEHFYQDPVNNRPRGAEPLADFSRRVWQAYEHIAREHNGKHVLIVAHAGVARAITASILKMSLADVYSRLRIGYGGIIHSTVDDDSTASIIIR